MRARVVCCFVYLLFALTSSAQEFRATISGHVYDSTRMAVPSAFIAMSLSHTPQRFVATDSGTPRRR